MGETIFSSKYRTGRDISTYKNGRSAPISENFDTEFEYVIPPTRISWKTLENTTESENQDGTTRWHFFWEENILLRFFKKVGLFHRRVT